MNKLAAMTLKTFCIFHIHVNVLGFVEQSNHPYISVSHFAISGGFEFLICLYQAFHLSINHLKESLRNNANLTFRVIFIKYVEAHRRNYWQHSAIFCLATAKRLLLLVIFWNKIFWLMKIKFCFFFYIPFFQ